MAACINNYTQPVALRVSTVSAAIDFHCLRLVTVLLLFLMFNSHLIFFFTDYVSVYLCLYTLPRFDLQFSLYSFYRVTLEKTFDYIDLNHQGCVQKCGLQFTNDQLRYHTYDISIRIS
jgi:hypothetical protein